VTQHVQQSESDVLVLNCKTLLTTKITNVSRQKFRIDYYEPLSPVKSLEDNEVYIWEAEIY
jgi:hypothetical protein